jgi:hypothetical protein
MPKGDSENFVKQLELVLEANKERKWITLYLDNAKWHKTKLVKDWVMKTQRLKLSICRNTRQRLIR